jgi:hypothetical protein
MEDFIPTHIASLGNSQDSPRQRIAVRIVRKADAERFYVTIDADGVERILFDQNLTPIRHEPTDKSPLIVEPPTQA